MSMFYSPQIVRALNCERIREARGGDCVDGHVFELPHRESGLVSALRRLVRRPSSDTATCGEC